MKLVRLGERYVNPEHVTQVWILTAHALGWESGTPCDRIRELDAQRRHDEHM